MEHGGTGTVGPGSRSLLGCLNCSTVHETSHKVVSSCQSNGLYYCDYYYFPKSNTCRLSCSCESDPSDIRSPGIRLHPHDSMRWFQAHGTSEVSDDAISAVDSNNAINGMRSLLDFRRRFLQVCWHLTSSFESYLTVPWSSRLQLLLYVSYSPPRFCYPWGCTARIRKRSG